MITAILTLPSGEVVNTAELNNFEPDAQPDIVFWRDIPYVYTSGRTVCVYTKASCERIAWD
jgi:hypothetical protein